MTKEWTTKDRLLAAMNLEEPDRVPITIRGAAPLEYLWSNPEEKLRVLLDLGIDAFHNIEPPDTCHPEVKITHSVEETSSVPILRKKVETPAGTLYTSVHKTPDMPFNEIPISWDWLWSHGVEFPINSFEDLPALDYMLPDPAQLDLTEFREMAARARKVADKNNTLLQGFTSGVPVVTMSLLDPKKMMYMIYDNRELIEATLERVGRWSDQIVSLFIDVGVDIIYRSACYEATDLYSPTHVRELFMPYLDRQIKLCHEADVKLHHFLQTGGMEFLEDYAKMGLDVFSSMDDGGVNPMDQEKCKQVLGGRVCLYGGVDAREPFEGGNAESVREEVLRVMSIMAPGGGYVLGPSGSFSEKATEENVRAYIKFGKEYGKYPLNL